MVIASGIYEIKCMCSIYIALHMYHCSIKTHLCLILDHMSSALCGIYWQDTFRKQIHSVIKKTYTSYCPSFISVSLIKNGSVTSEFH